MPRSDAETRVKLEPNATEGRSTARRRSFPPVRARVERAFRWLAHFQDEPRFERTPLNIKG